MNEGKQKKKGKKGSSRFLLMNSVSRKREGK